WHAIPIFEGGNLGALPRPAAIRLDTKQVEAAAGAARNDVATPTGFECRLGDQYLGIDTKIISDLLGNGIQVGDKVFRRFEFDGIQRTRLDAGYRRLLGRLIPV